MSPHGAYRTELAVGIGSVAGGGEGGGCVAEHLGAAVHQRALAVGLGAGEVGLDAYRHLGHAVTEVLKLEMRAGSDADAEERGIQHVPCDFVMAARLDDNLTKVGKTRSGLLEFVQSDLNLLQSRNFLDVTCFSYRNINILHSLLTVQRCNIE